MTKRHVVVTIHGIRTRGTWQKVAATWIANSEMTPEAPDYGHFGLIRFASSYFRNKEIERFHQFYGELVAQNQLDTDDPQQRPSIIAHSFGSYIVANCLMKYEDVQLNKLIICGSIVDRDFNWSLLFARDQVNEVLNDCGLKDKWVRLAPLLIHDAGSSGCDGFTYFGTLLKQRFGDQLEHSDYFKPHQMKVRWLPTLEKPPSRLRVLQSRDINSHDEVTLLLNCANKIDNDRYGDLPEYPEQELPRGLSKKWLEVNPDLYAFLVHRETGELIGYINAIPVTEDLASQIRTGSIVDNHLDPDEILPFGPSTGQCSLYVMSIAERRGGQFRCGLYPEPLERLINALLSKLLHYAIQHKFVAKEILAVGWKPPGRRLCQMFGMKEVAQDRHGHPVYQLLMDEALSTKVHVHSGLRKLALSYQQRGLLAQVAPRTSGANEAANGRRESTRHSEAHSS